MWAKVSVVQMFVAWPNFANDAIILAELLEVKDFGLKVSLAKAKVQVFEGLLD